MIQEIFPHTLNNQYTPEKISGADTVLYFKENTLLSAENEGLLSCPSYDEFSDGCDKEKNAFDYIYLLEAAGERFFLAMEKNGVRECSFTGKKLHTDNDNMLKGYEFTDVNVFRRTEPKYRAYAVITAYHLYGWYRDNRICGRCGNTLRHSDKERMVYCSECGNSIYPKICPAVIVAVTNKDKLLLTKYAQRTYKNYALVAGFAEIGETIEETVIREVYEEVGLRVKNIEYYKSQPWGLSGSLLFGFYCELDGDDKITLQEEELSVGEWIAAKDIPLEDDGVSLTREMIVNFAKKFV